MLLQQGLTLFEIILALFFLSISLLGLARLDLLSLHAHHLAYQTSIATAQAFSIVQRLKANPLKYSEELLHWNEQNKKILPNGNGEVICDANRCKVLLNWFYQGKRSLSVSIQK